MSLTAPTLFCSSTGPDGTRRANSTCPATSPRSSCPRARQSSTRSRTSGSICARIGSQTPCSKTTTPSSTPHAKPGANSSPTRKESHPSACETGPTSVSRYDPWYKLKTFSHQRCWLHKTLNVLDKLPKSMQPNAHKDLREIWRSANRHAAEAAMTTFAEKYAPKYDKAVECLIKDRQTLLMFFDLPADHWDHLRTSNPIESVFATVRHRTVRMKGALSQDTARLMVFKLVKAPSRTWRRLQGQNQLPKVVNGIKFKDGIEAVAEIKSAA